MGERDLGRPETMTRNRVCALSCDKNLKSKIMQWIKSRNCNGDIRQDVWRKIIEHNMKITR